MLIYLNLLTLFNKNNSLKIWIYQNKCLPLPRQTIKIQLGIMESYMDDKIWIGDYIVSDIMMLDDDTCTMYFKEFTEGNVMYGIVVEYWLDEDSWHFVDNRFAIDGSLINSEESTHLLEEDKQKCKEIIESWLDKQRNC